MAGAVVALAVGARADRQPARVSPSRIRLTLPMALAPPVLSPLAAGASAFPDSRGPALEGSPRLGLGGTRQWRPAPQVPPSTPRNGRALGGLRAGKLLEENANPLPPPPGPRAAAATSPGEATGPSRAHAHETSGGERAHAPEGAARACVCACMSGVGGALLGAKVAATHQRELEFTTRALLKKPNPTLRLSPGKSWSGGRRPSVPAARRVHVSNPRGALGPPRPACRAPETGADGTVSPRKCLACRCLVGLCRPAASPSPRPRGAGSDSRSGLGPAGRRRGPGPSSGPATVTSASLGRAGVPAGATSPQRPAELWPRGGQVPGESRTHGASERSGRWTEATGGQPVTLASQTPPFFESPHPALPSSESPASS